MSSSREGGGNEKVGLFETRKPKGRLTYKLFASTIFVGICLIWVYRIWYIPRAGEPGRWVWIGLFVAELWFGFYWVITQSVRWNVIFRYPFKERLSQRYGDKMPAVDIFVCTADPTIEPPIMIANTVLSVMAYDYPPEKLSVYLSDDGGSDLTFYALFEASRFARHWIPFCNKFQVEPRSPAVYFPASSSSDKEWLSVKMLYEDMRNRIETAVELGRIPEEIKGQHKGFWEWKSRVSKRDHHTILQILIDGRDSSNPTAVDIEGHALPTLVYLAREKRPQFPHNFKAGAMNALIRVSSEITNGQIILNVDCDMYSNDPEALRDALCFFMDEENGDEIAYVQFPQYYDNIINNDIYGNISPVINKLELAGADGYGGSLYCGSGCFHRREALSGKKYNKGYKVDWNKEIIRKMDKTHKSVCELEESSKVLANCTYENGTQWGKEMGLIYGCPAEDVITGLTIQCRGWKSVLYNPEKRGFLGVAPITLDQSLVQFKRWAEGMFQIAVSKYCPFWYGLGKIKIGLQMAYCVYCLWAPNSFPTLYYVVVTPVSLLEGISLFPQMSSLWFVPFAFVFIGKNVGGLVEAVCCGQSSRQWWNLQRMVLIRRTTSFLFGFTDTIVKKLGFSQTAFVITAKVADQDVSKRYEQGLLEFGTSSPMFTILATVALLNLFSLVWALKRVALDMELKAVEQLVSQIVLCGLVVLINIPVYQALFIRKDKGRMPTSVTVASTVLASLLCLMPMY
ncbi:PREDICTED: cellulose synthase-like protein E6 [Nelumbo nucifera]|uniref:Cellulose synthase-like protein E6 n=1 Tax=Nelumbo nucifera TaxID=4432 RepID=A0A1U7ZWB8_NELNU|nr:PREDICTED: cellulose synthase-like protein E6 [Nelumbo nucifera]